MAWASNCSATIVIEFAKVDWNELLPVNLFVPSKVGMLSCPPPPNLSYLALFPYFIPIFYHKIFIDFSNLQMT